MKACKTNPNTVMKLRICLFALLGLLWTAGCSDEKAATLDYAAIDALIEECTQLHDSAEEGEGLGEFVKGSKAIFRSSIDEALYVRNNTDRQSALDNYCTKLTTARDVFLSSKVAPACPLFDGTGHIDCGMAAQFLSANMTIEAWVYINESTGGAIIGAEGADKNGGLGGLLIRLAEGVENAIDFCMVNNTWSSCFSPANSAPHKQWIHIAATFDSENVLLYLNGELEGSIKIAPYTPDSNGKFIIGDLALYSGRQFRGKIYDVRIWNTTRSAEEIAANFRRLLTGDEEGLVANWPLTVKSGNSITDLTGRYPATLMNIQWADLDNL